MQTITIEAQLKTTVDQKIEMPVPFYSRSEDETNWLAMLDEKTVIRFFVLDGYASMGYGPLTTFKSEVIEAWQTFHGCTEAEFLQKYDEIIDSMHPALKA